MLTTIAQEGRKFDVLLKRFAIRPVPNYTGFMSAAVDDGWMNVLPASTDVLAGDA